MALKTIMSTLLFCIATTYCSASADIQPMNDKISTRASHKPPLTAAQNVDIKDRTSIGQPTLMSMSQDKINSNDDSPSGELLMIVGLAALSLRKFKHTNSKIRIDIK